MYFLAPAAFALAALMPVIIAMYLLKLRRTEQLVSSVYLWQRMVRDLEANAPWQRLRRNLLLILQLLFLGALILALARPFTRAEGTSGQALILILDTSASMAASDVPPSRLEAAKVLAQQLADSQPDDARVTLITASDGTQVVVASSQDRRQVRLAIESIRAGTGGSDLTAALELASAIAARQPETEIVLLSDGRVTLPEQLAVSSRSPAWKGRIRYVPMGQSGDNQAISNLSLESVPGSGSLVAFVQVANYDGAPAQRRLTLYADDQLINAFDLEIPPAGQQAVVAEDLPADTRVLEAQLAGQDVLTLDDRAWAVHHSAGPTPALLVTEGNLFLEAGLALLPGLEVTTVRPDDFEKGWKDENAEEKASLPTNQTTNQLTRLTILDAYVPLTATLPAGNLLFIAPPRSTAYFTITGSLDLPAPRPADTEDPILAYVNLAESNVLEAAHMSLPPWAHPVIMGDVPGETIPLLFAGQVDGRRIAVLAFDLHRSDLPLQVAFPLLLANLTGWLAPGSGGDLPTQVPPGAAVTLSTPPEVESATVTRPDGSTARLIPEAGRQIVFGDTSQLGVYEVAWQSPEPVEGRSPEPVEGQSPEPVEGQSPEPVEGGEANQVRFAVNMFSSQESNVRPVGTLPVSGEGEVREDERPQQSRREWWRPLALVGLALLMAEWLVYQRASLSRLWRETRQIVK